MGFLGGSDGKESALSERYLGLIPGSGRCPGEENGNPLSIISTESHGQRSLAGYSPSRDHQESVTTEQLIYTHMIALTMCLAQIIDHYEPI